MFFFSMQHPPVMKLREINKLLLLYWTQVYKHHMQLWKITVENGKKNEKSKVEEM